MHHVDDDDICRTCSSREIKERDDDAKSQASRQSNKSNQSARSGSSKGGSSVTSSAASKSVYQVDGDDEDEWATLVKFDT